MNLQFSPTRTVLLGLALLLGLAGAAFAAADSIPLPAERPHYQIPRAQSAITVDGKIDEEAWSHALALPLSVEIDPGKNLPAPVAGTAYLLYDENKLYAAFRCDDPSPKDIRAHLTDRDTPYRDDFVGLMLDTFNDERRGYELFVNPHGVQMDLAMSEASDNKEDPAWDAIWSSAGRIHETGYTVEMAIPFNSLRFQRSGGEQTWGILAFRSYPRSLRHQIATMPLDPDNPCLLCQLPKVTGFAGATPGRNLEFDPTATAHRTDVRPDGSRSLAGGDVESDLGVTARWGITPNLILSGALNPDFSQVEADAAQLDVNTDFALFYPEKRPFFLEGADFFTTPLQAVYTRTVADPTWGVKLTGKEGKNGLGVFVAEDDQTNLLLPGSQSSSFGSLDGGSTDAALRYRRDLGKSSMLGALATHRQGDGGYANDVFGLDGLFRPTTSDRITFQALSSRSELAADSFDGSAWRLGYDHSSRHWSWYARREVLSRGFRADLGFMPRVGYSFDLAGLEHTWWSEKKDAWYTRFAAGGDWDLTRDANDTVLERELEVWVNLSGPLQSYYSLDGGRRDRFWDGVTYDQTFLNVYTEMRPTGALYLELGGTFGDAIDFVHSRAARQVRLDPAVSYDFGKKLRVGVNHHYQKLTVAGGRLFTANLTELRTVYQLNLRTFVRAILQYEDVDRTRLYTAAPGTGASRDLFSQLLFAYKLNPQTVLFLGYNDNAANDLVPDELTRKDRTLFLKIGYALVL
ncbi:MAG TPA: sugar-binding protein [Thermoanaerobaculia bacterium]|jgi:hypothetical protein